MPQHFGYGASEFAPATGLSSVVGQSGAFSVSALALMTMLLLLGLLVIVVATLIIMRGSRRLLARRKKRGSSVPRIDAWAEAGRRMPVPPEEDEPSR
ncbi:MAG: hypothetical protein SFZ23_01105 [Planctomycetota bacterium]|nr:hypothetical protein [Planctomycetota bacterium]